MAVTLEQVLKPVFDKYSRYLGGDVELAPEEFDRSQLTNVKSKSHKTYDLNISRDRKGDYFVSLKLNDRTPEKWFERSREVRKEVGRKFREVVESRKGKLAKSAKEVLKSYKNMEKAGQKGKLKARKEFQSEAWDFYVDLWEQTIEGIEEHGELNKKYGKFIKGVSKGVNDDTVALFEEIGYRKDLKVGGEPKVTFLTDSDFGYVLLANAVGRMAGDATAFEGEDYQKLLSTKKKRKWKYIGLFAASLAAAGIGAYVLYRRAKMAQSLATQAVQELQPLKDQAADMNKWAAERYAEKQEELLNRAGNLHGESQPIVDMDGDGKADYYDADGDGNWDDNDLDNDGIRDYNPDTLVKEDIDAPENDYAYARAVVEDLGYTSDPNANLYYAGWKEALVKWDESVQLSQIANSMGVDIDGDGKLDFKLVKDTGGQWIFSGDADVDLDNDGKPDIIIERDEHGYTVWKLNDADSPYTQYVSEARQDLINTSSALGARISDLKTNESKVDMDGDGKADYYDADGDGNWDDNDLDNDGIRDYNPDTLVKEDIDAPENDYAYARAVVEDLGYTSDPNANLYYAGWKEAYTQLEIAEDLQSYVGTELNGLVSGLNRLEHDMGDILTQVLEKESVLGSHLANSTLYNFLTAGVGLVETGVTGAAYHGKWLAGRKTMPYLLDKVGGLEIKRVK